MSHTLEQRAVIFDIGGVMVRICHTWQDAAAVTGIETPLLPPEPVSLMDAPGFDAYQAGEIPLEQYTSLLASFLGCTPEQAFLAHQGILKDEYPGIGQLVEELTHAQVVTGCLSNTNAPHWVDLTQHPRFETVHKLQFKMASHEVGLAKPDPRIFELYCQTIGLAPAHITYFDDNRANVESAVSLGWNAHLIDPEGDTVAQMRQVIASLMASV